MQKLIANETRRRERHSPMEHPRHQYPQEAAALQKIAWSCGLVEKIKWGKPCFTLGDKNIVLIQRFNKYIALLFFKGALLRDPGQLLFRVGEHMQAPRQLRFSSVAEIECLSSAIKAFIEQAIELEKSGAKVELKRVSDLRVPEELQIRLDAEPALRKAFAGLTPGRQKVTFTRLPLRNNLPRALPEWIGSFRRSWLAKGSTISLPLACMHRRHKFC